MNDAVREMLCEVIRRFGPEIVSEPGKLASILRDKGARHKREVSCLVAGLQAGVPQMLASSSAVPWEILEARLLRRLLDDVPLDEAAGRECVLAWGKALGREPRTAAPAKKPPLAPAAPRVAPAKGLPRRHVAAAPKKGGAGWVLVLVLMLAGGAAVVALGYPLLRHRIAVPQAGSHRRDGEKAAALAARGAESLAAGRHAEAEEQYGAALALAPGVAGWHVRRAACRFALGRFADAIADCDATLKLGEDDEARSWRGRARLRLGRDDEDALDDLSRAVEQGSDRAETYAARALILLRRKRHDEAIADCDVALRKDGKLAEARWARAQAYKERGLEARGRSTASALSDLEEYLHFVPSDHATFALCGDMRFERKEYDKAIEAFGKAIEGDARNQHAVFQRGLARLRTKRYKDAEQDFIRCLELVPNNWAAHHNRAICLENLGKHEPALQAYASALALKKDADTFTGRANLLSKLKRHEDAIKDADAALALDANRAGAYFVRGYANDALGRKGKAMEDYTACVKLDPKHSAALHNRGNLHSDRKEYPEAIADYTTAIAADPMYAGTYRARAIACRAAGKADEAAADEAKAKALETAKK